MLGIWGASQYAFLYLWVLVKWLLVAAIVLFQLKVHIETRTLYRDVQPTYPAYMEEAHGCLVSTSLPQRPQPRLG